MLHYWKHLNKVDKLSFVFGEDFGTWSWVIVEWLKYKQMVVWIQVIEDEDIILKRERVNGKGQRGSERYFTHNQDWRRLDFHWLSQLKTKKPY